MIGSPAFCLIASSSSGAPPCSHPHGDNSHAGQGASPESIGCCSSSDATLPIGDNVLPSSCPCSSLDVSTRSIRSASPLSISLAFMIYPCLMVYLVQSVRLDLAHPTAVLRTPLVIGITRCSTNEGNTNTSPFCKLITVFFPKDWNSNSPPVNSD